MPQIAFIGLGVMGFPMAGHLKQAGHEVCVYNRSSEKSEKWVSTYGGLSANTPAQASKNADFVMTCVGNDDDVRSVVYGADGLLAGLSADAVFIDHTTTSANLARELDKAAQGVDVHFIDAPVSGGQAGAENGILTIMCGGEEPIFNRAEPVLKAYAQKVALLGETGSGQLCKMVNQICVAGLVQALSEGLHFAQEAGLDGEKVIDTISKGAAQSWQMENRYKTMLENEFDFGFAVDWMRKDLDYCLEEANRINANLPQTETINKYYSDIQQMGGGRWDTSSLIRRLKEGKS